MWVMQSMNPHPLAQYLYFGLYQIYIQFSICVEKNYNSFSMCKTTFVATNIIVKDYIQAHMIVAILYTIYFDRNVYFEVRYGKCILYNRANLSNQLAFNGWDSHAQLAYQPASGISLRALVMCFHHLPWISHWDIRYPQTPMVHLKSILDGMWKHAGRNSCKRCLCYETRYVDGTPTSEVTAVAIWYIRKPHHG